MNQAEIIGPEIQCDRGFQIDQFFREGQRETMKPSYFHPKPQVLPFHVGRTNLTVIRDAQHFRNLRARHARRRIATRARILRGIYFGDLA